MKERSAGESPSPAPYGWNFPAKLGTIALFTRICSVVPAVIALLCLGGWAFDWRGLRAFTSSGISMNPLTALIFIGLSTMIFLRNRANLRGEWAQAGRWLSNVLLVLTLLQVAESVFGIGFGLDRIFFSEKLNEVGINVPNRMAPNTAVGFFLCAFALKWIFQEEPRVRLAQLLSISVWVLSYFAILGYLYSAEILYHVSGHYPPMALSTAAAFLFFSTALLLLKGDDGFMKSITTPAIGGQVARRVLPFVVVIPAVFGWFRILGQNLGLYDTATGAALTVVFFVVALGGVILWTADSLNRADHNRIEAEEKLQRLNRDLQIQTENLIVTQKELESFSYSVSHDLRAPLRHISGFAELLRKSAGELDAKSNRYLNIISDAASQMGRLIDDLLLFSRLGRTELQHSKVDLNEILEESIQLVLRETNGREIIWRKTQLPYVLGDASMLRQVFVNLLSNAIKYSRPRPRSEIDILFAENEGTDVVIAVKDNGVGFDMKYADKLFGVFQRLHKVEDFEGTGIGLANVRRVITRHGGKTWAESEPGKGAMFYFSLPGERVVYGKSEKNSAGGG